MSRTAQFRILVALTLVWAGWAGWSLLSRSTPYDLVVLDDLGAPVVGANVDGDGDQLGVSGSDGVVAMEWRSESVLEVSAPGHVTKMVNLPERPEDVVPVVLTARVLRAHVLDPDGLPVVRARVVTAAGEAVTDADGKVSIRGAEPGEVEVKRPAWASTTFTWDGGAGESQVTIEPFIAKAVHVRGEAVRDRFEDYLKMTDNTELNAVMVDVKDESGTIWYRTKNATALEIKANNDAFDLKTVVDQAHARDLYVIVRLVSFSDPIAAKAKPSMAVWDTATNAPFHANNQYFLDPTDPDATQYALELAEELCALGVDEVQFDYVRFPDVRPQSVQFDQGVSSDTRKATIEGFLTDAVELLHPMGCAVAADVFGFLTTAVDDGGIGQYWEGVTGIVDVVSPMLYPSHYTTGWYGFDVPNNNPGPVVRRALADGVARLPRNAIVRPWLQDFGNSYGRAEVRAQIDSAEEFGLGWMLWNALSIVQVDALKPAP